MSLRTRLLLAFAAVVLIPIALLAFGLRQEMTRRLSQEYQLRVDRVVQTIHEDLARESAGIIDRLASLETALQNDNRFRLAAVAGVESEREYLLDYAGTAMRLTGLSMLQIQDANGRILSSGHFRNEHGLIDGGLATALHDAPGPAFVMTRGPEREFPALARVEPVPISGRTFTIIGGVGVDEAFLAQLARDRAIGISLRYPGGELSTGPPRQNSRDGGGGTAGGDTSADAAQDASAQHRFMAVHDGSGSRPLRASPGRLGVVAYQRTARGAR
jgi:hypothetical protein